MAVSAIRRVPLAALLMLGCSVIAVPAQAGWFDSDSKPATKADAKNAAAQPATSLDDSINQAQALRLAGSYPEAIKHLSQVMMVASDDPRVVSEYGKTLAAMGRPSDAVNFLTRAQQLQPGDWTVYSALGVAYDQIGDQKNAQLNYDLALKLKPEEPSVLSNYALSRLLAKDPDMARALAARAEKAGGDKDARIGRNIAMIRSIVPEAPVQKVAQAPVPAPAAASAPAHAPVAVAVAVANSVQPPTVAQSDNRVVMQKVPVDPLAGPVQTAAKPAPVVATNAPRPLQAKPVETPVTPAPVKAAEIKPVPVKTAEPITAVAKVTPPVKTADAKPAPVATAPVATAKLAPAAPVKAVAVKAVPVTFRPLAPLTAAQLAPIKIVEPAVVAAAKVAAPVKAAEVKTVKPAQVAPVVTAKAIPTAPVKAADAKPAPVKPVEPVAVAAAKAIPAAPLKTAETKPVPAKPAEPVAVATVKMTPPAPVKTADAKPAALVPVKTTETKPVVKTVGQAKDAIPGLRLSANAY